MPDPHELEPQVLSFIDQALGDAPLLPVCGEWEQNPRLRASFDGITKDGIPVELKAPCQKVYSSKIEKGEVRRSQRMEGLTFRIYTHDHHAHHTY